jgi:polyphosphate kinase 2 (PPK2 family)
VSPAALGEGEGERAIIVFEGRDGAGKGGTIRAITERVSPRVFRVVALPAPSDREKCQLYMQRYMQHFPAARRGGHLRSQLVQPRRRRDGDGLLHDRRVQRFLQLCPLIETFMSTAASS